MNRVKHLREPGFLYDLLFIYSLIYNKTEHISKFLNFNKADENMNLYKQIISDYQPASAELTPFFYMHNGGACVLEKSYLMKKQLLDGFHFPALCTAINDTDLLRKNLLNYYCPSMPDDQSWDSKSFLDKISLAVSELPIPDPIKYSLLSFYINPERYIKMLLHQLEKANTQLKNYYSEHENIVNDILKEINLQSVWDKLIRFNIINNSVKLTQNKTYVSFCLLHVNTMVYKHESTGELLILGSDFMSQLDSHISEAHPLALEDVGKVLSEPNRLYILDYLSNNAELTSADAAKLLGVTPTAAYYHFELMIRCHLLRVRNEGRTIFYSINKNTFAEAIKLIEKYAK